MTLPDAQKIKVKSLTRKYDGFFKIDELIFDHPTFKGEMIENIRREIFVRLDAVAVLPYDPVHDTVLLTRQLRIASAGKMESPWIVELIAGLVDKTDEAFVNVAEREALEEAGLNISNLIPICDFFPSVGGSNEKLYLFLALTDLSQAGGYFGLAEEHEDIDAFVVSREQAMDMIFDGEIQTASTIIALQWLQLNHHRYQRK
ncbi:NUDIX domain-containing protein [Wohlfahrtiimonas populi]|uniref:NUDIX domain-containing protein n=1 Tax=Wohlfahrtiimonas populi TaxID=1940240 RepID=UPI00098D101E|nr:NUDIX domain-containing protein [Wohlfahrtiimonas populi]